MPCNQLRRARIKLVTLSVLPHSATGQAVGCLPSPDEGQANKEMVNRFYSEAWGGGDPDRG